MLLRRIKLTRNYPDVDRVDTIFKFINSRQYTKNLEDSTCEFCKKPLEGPRFNKIERSRKTFFNTDTKASGSLYKFDVCIIHPECRKQLVRCSHKRCPQLYHEKNDNPKCDMCSNIICAYHQHSTKIPNKNYRFNMCYDCVLHGRIFRYWVLKQTKLCDDVIRNILDFFPKPSKSYMFFDPFYEK
jgi:hypothetical protein